MRDLYIMKSTSAILKALIPVASQVRERQKYEFLQEKARKINPNFKIPYIELWPGAIRKRVHLSEGDTIGLGRDMTDSDVAGTLMDFIEEKPSIDTLIWGVVPITPKVYDWEKTFSALKTRYNVVIADLGFTLWDLYKV